MILLKCDHITVKNSCECQNCEPSVQRYFLSLLNIFIEKVETKKSIDHTADIISNCADCAL